MDIFMRGVAYGATEDYLKVELAKILHKAPFPREPLLNFEVSLFKKSTKRGKVGILTLPSERAGRMFLHAHGYKKGLTFKGRKVEFHLHDGPLDEEKVARLNSRPWKAPQQIRMEKEQRIREGRPYPLKSYAFGRLASKWFSSEFVAEGSADIVCDLGHRVVRFTLRKQVERTADSDDRLVTLMRDLEIQPLISTTIASYPLDAIHSIIESGAAEEPIIFIRANTSPSFATDTHSAGNDHTDTQRSQGLIPGVAMPPGCFSLACTFADEGDKEAFIYAARSKFHLRYFPRQALTSRKLRNYEIPTDDINPGIDDEVPI